MNQLIVTLRLLLRAVEYKKRNVQVESWGDVAPTLKKFGGHVPPLPPRLLRHCVTVRCLAGVVSVIDKAAVPATDSPRRWYYYYMHAVDGDLLRVLL